MYIMWFVPTILCGLLFAGVASGLANCGDCVTLSQCAEALRRTNYDRTQETRALFKSSLCGVKPTKVCCSKFSAPVPAQDEIENHRNVQLLPQICGDKDGDRVIGGVATGLYEFPWMALISYRKGGKLTFGCGGTVISSRYVLTAAHCVKDQSIAGVRIGEYDITTKVDCVGIGRKRECENGTYQDIRVSNPPMYHPNYSKFPVVVNDIGLLRLKRKVDFSRKNAAMICLPVSKQLRQMELSGLNGIVAGWGVTENDRRSNILLKVEVPIISTQSCGGFYSMAMIADGLRNTLCAGDLGHDSCKGDSGGPLKLEAPYGGTSKFVQFGVVSYGSSECGTKSPGVYTDVRKYMKWILDNIGP